MDSNTDTDDDKRRHELFLSRNGLTQDQFLALARVYGDEAMAHWVRAVTDPPDPNIVV
ncbi:hypothetical protein [Streptomyces sp. UG1]|uniref:hypothetical protein n=1 Tax=Streptomyces sp. UG1 TaxID=3417652 RepID=UPI003CFAD0E0